MADFLEFFAKYIPVLLEGALITLKLTAIGLGLGMAIGLPTAVARVYGGKWIGGIAKAYIQVFRGTPALVQLFIIYFGLPDAGITLSRLMSAYIALGLNSGAYQAEYFRGAIQAIGSGQMKAARAIGMTRIQAVRFIILPQALRLVIPAWSNEPISLLKTSAIAFLISVPDLMTEAKFVASKTYNPISSYLAAAVVYLVLAFMVNGIMGWLEKKSAIPGMKLSSSRT
jgi:polar amino acid transport system permease protein